jgi:hypothetical protein
VFLRQFESSYFILTQSAAGKAFLELRTAFEGCFAGFFGMNVARHLAGRRRIFFIACEDL